MEPLGSAYWDARSPRAVESRNVFEMLKNALSLSCDVLGPS